MRILNKVVGWIILIAGVLGTASNAAFIATGAQGRLGSLFFTIALVALGLWFAQPFRKPTQ